VGTLVPFSGMNHCGGGPALDNFDALAAIVNWVENGKAPARHFLAQAVPCAPSRPMSCTKGPIPPKTRSTLSASRALFFLQSKILGKHLNDWDKVINVEAKD
jgi:hypothetical protein